MTSRSPCRSNWRGRCSPISNGSRPACPAPSCSRSRATSTEASSRSKVGPITAPVPRWHGPVRRSRRGRGQGGVAGRGPRHPGPGHRLCHRHRDPRGTESGTGVRIETDLDISGKVAQFGRGASGRGEREDPRPVCTGPRGKRAVGRRADRSRERRGAGRGRRHHAAGSSTPRRPNRSTCSTRPVARCSSGSFRSWSGSSCSRSCAGCGAVAIEARTVSG